MTASYDPENDPEICIAATRDDNHYGEIDAASAAAAGIQPGLILLYRGWPGPKGWGHRHVLSTPGRVDIIKRCGFADERAYALAVASGWKLIHEGDGGKAQRIMVYLPQGKQNLGLALQRTKNYWSITTMLPFFNISANYAKLYER